MTKANKKNNVLEGEFLGVINSTAPKISNNTGLDIPNTLNVFPQKSGILPLGKVQVNGMNVPIEANVVYTKQYAPGELLNEHNSLLQRISETPEEELSKVDTVSIVYDVVITLMSPRLGKMGPKK